MPKPGSGTSTTSGSVTVGNSSDPRHIRRLRNIMSNKIEPWQTDTPNGYSNKTEEWILVLGWNFTSPTSTAGSASTIEVTDALGNTISRPHTIQPWQENTATLTFQGGIYPYSPSAFFIPPGCSLVCSSDVTRMHGVRAGIIQLAGL